MAKGVVLSYRFATEVVTIAAVVLQAHDEQEYILVCP